jgi:hypothetical protein
MSKVQCYTSAHAEKIKVEERIRRAGADELR